MTVITTTLYYDGFEYDDDCFFGRALTKKHTPRST